VAACRAARHALPYFFLLFLYFQCRHSIKGIYPITIKSTQQSIDLVIDHCESKYVALYFGIYLQLHEISFTDRLCSRSIRNSSSTLKMQLLKVVARSDFWVYYAILNFGIYY